MPILNSLIPLVAVIGLGAILRKQGFLSDEATKTFNAFAYFWALPLFLFYKLALAPQGPAQANAFTVTLLGATVATLCAGWLATRLLKLPAGSQAAFIQASYRGNLAFFGLPLILFSLDLAEPQQASQLEAAVLLAFAPCIIFYNVTAVALLALHNPEVDQPFCWKRLSRTILFNPLLIACALGWMFQSMTWPVPLSLERTCQVVGASAFPLALLGIGSQLATLSFHGRWSTACWTSVLKCVVCPLAGFLIGRSMGLSPLELKIILILCAVPTAVSSYVLVDQMDGDSDLAAGAVVTGTIFSLIPLALILGW